MYDKFNEIKMASLGRYIFMASRFEVWSGGKKIQANSCEVFISFNAIEDLSEFPIENGHEVSIEPSIGEELITSKFYFDVGYTAGDRVLFSIIPASSNCQEVESFNTFIQLAPIQTRLHKEFDVNEPYACSVFFIKGEPEKISFSIARSRLLIEFYRQ